MRKLATIRKISKLLPIPGADAIEVAVVDGWKIVVKKGDFKEDTLIVMCEIDSWIPHNIAPFLSKGKEPRLYEGVLGEKLRTVKLRGALSQGLLLCLEDVFQVVEKDGRKFINIPNYKGVGADNEHLQNNKPENQ